MPEKEITVRTTDGEMTTFPRTEGPAATRDYQSDDSRD